jgi:uncharacterized protein (TIGR02145 family)
VQFRVSWDAIPEGACHNSKIWLWVDFIKIENNQPSGSWTRATVATASPAASVSYDGNNRQGFWLQGNDGSYRQIVTVALANIPANTTFNWCAYASDCPPNVTANNGTYTFKGTPPFTLIASDGATTQTVNETTLATSALTVTPTTIRDKTECPGIFCPYTGSDLFIDADHLCQQRTSGAKNWEAWIKDTRDDELYRIVLMPDNNWWLAQNVKYEGTGYEITYGDCTKETCGRWYQPSQANGSYGGTSGYGANIQGVCPNDWILPVDANWNELLGSLADEKLTAVVYLRSDDTQCGSNNIYGWSSKYVLWRRFDFLYGDAYYSNDDDGSCLCMDPGYKCGGPSAYYIGGDWEGNAWRVRCFRQL